MGIWNLLSSTAEQVKSHAPDTSSLKNAYNTTCSYGSAGLTTLRHWVPDDETKSTIAAYATIFAKNAGHYALKEGYKAIPGGAAVSEIVSKTLDDVKYDNLEAEKLKALGGTRTPVQMNKIDPQGQDQGPQELIQSFMNKDFFGNHFFDNLIVTQYGKGEGQKLRENP